MNHILLSRTVLLPGILLEVIQNNNILVLNINIFIFVLLFNDTVSISLCVPLTGKGQ
jgi:hypothetical protein